MKAVTLSVREGLPWEMLYADDLVLVGKCEEELKEISRFSGEGNVEDWLDRFETAVSLDHEELCKAELLIMRLEGVAFTTWKGKAN